MSLTDQLARSRLRTERAFARLARNARYAAALRLANLAGMTSLLLAVGLLAGPALLTSSITGALMIGAGLLVIAAALASLPGSPLRSRQGGLLALAWAAVLAAEVVAGRFALGRLGAATAASLLAFTTAPMAALAVAPRLAPIWVAISLVGLGLLVTIAGVDAAFSVVLLVGLAVAVVCAAAIYSLGRRESRDRELLMSAVRQLHGSTTPEEIASRMITPLLALPGITAAAVLHLTRAGYLVPISVAGRPGGLQLGESVSLERSREILGSSRPAAWAGYWPNGSDGAFATDEDTEAFLAGYAALYHEGVTVGLLAVATPAADGPLAARAIDDALPLLTDFAAVAAAALAPSLTRRERDDNERLVVLDVISRRSFRPVFQPIVRLSDKVVVGFEALTRFDDNARPDKRFEKAAELGLAIELEAVTIEAAIEAAHALPAGWLSINVTPSLLCNGGLLLSLLSKADREIVLEITEAEPITDHLAVEQTRKLLGRGVRIAIDDAGQRYSGLEHIVRLRPDYVKLDISLIHDIHRDQTRRALASGLAAFARAADPPITLIAEGVETAEEFAELDRLAIGLGQGYLLGRPASVDSLNSPAALPN